MHGLADRMLNSSFQPAAMIAHGCRTDLCSVKIVALGVGWFPILLQKLPARPMTSHFESYLDTQCDYIECTEEFRGKIIIILSSIVGQELHAMSTDITSNRLPDLEEVILIVATVGFQVLNVLRHRPYTLA